MPGAGVGGGGGRTAVVHGDGGLQAGLHDATGRQPAGDGARERGVKLGSRHRGRRLEPLVQHVVAARLVPLRVEVSDARRQRGRLEVPRILGRGVLVDAVVDGVDGLDKRFVHLQPHRVHLGVDLGPVHELCAPAACEDRTRGRLQRGIGRVWGALDTISLPWCL